ncbi:MAG: hypothetical protein PVJ81_07360 [Dehalococcoidia bacterium]|jgi:hypothetical protein
MLPEIQPYYEILPPFWTAKTIGFIALGAAAICAIGYLIYLYHDRIADFFRRG